MQATAPANAAAGATDLQAQPAAAAQQPALLPALPNIFGRKLRQVILNPGDLVGLRTDNTKATPSAADAARLGAALGLQVMLFLIIIRHPARSALHGQGCHQLLVTSNTETFAFCFAPAHAMWTLHER